MYSKFNKKDNDSMITMRGIIIGDEDILFTRKTRDLDALMRAQDSALRTSFKDITVRNLNREESVNKNKCIFINNSRYMRDAFGQAESLISSQRELLPTYLENETRKKSQLENKILKLSKAKKDKAKNIELIKIYEKKIKIADYEIHNLTNHIANETIPQVVFGGKSNLKLLNKNKITKDEWKNSRSNNLYSVGEKSKGGNENIKLVFIENNIFSINILNPLVGVAGSRIEFNVKFPEKMANEIKNYLLTGEAYTVRIIRTFTNYHVDVTLSAKYDVIGENRFSYIAGIDINPDNLSVVIANNKGNFITSKIFKFPEINYLSSRLRGKIIAETIIKLVNFVKSYNVNTIIVEDLSFSQNFTYNNNLNRTLSNFIHSKVLNTLAARCYKEKLMLRKINPSYTSLIGRTKYQKALALSVHEAAAYVIVRRGMKLNEKIPKHILSNFFAMEVKGRLKINIEKNKEFWKNIYQFFNNKDFRKVIFSLDKFHLDFLGIKRNPREWFIEDYINFSSFYMMSLFKAIFTSFARFNIDINSLQLF